MSLGENIYKLRTGRKMSQEDFASAMEVSRQSVSKWENNMAVPELEKLIKMAKLFEVSLDELVGNAPPQPKPEPEPVPTPTPVPALGITIGDLISVVLLIFGILFPVFAICTIHIFNSWILLAAGLYVMPILAILGAAYCSPRNKLMLRIFTVYAVIICIVGSLFMMGAPVLIPIFVFPTAGVLLFWSSRCEE